MMKSKYVRGGFTGGILLVVACNTSVIDPIGGGPGGAAGQGGDSGAGRNGASGTGGASGAGESAAGRAGERGGGRAGAPPEAAGQPGDDTAGSGGSAGSADCDDLRMSAEQTITTNTACEQNSDCELFNAPCLFPTHQACSNQYGVSKLAHGEVSRAFDEYQACAGKCQLANTCAPVRIAQCSQGKCLNQPQPSAPTCAAISAQAAAAVAGQETCTLVTRVDSVSLAVTGHVIVCGPRNIVDEAGARASADAATSNDPLEGSLGSGALLSSPNPNDAWVFSQINGDFGHLSAVSAVNGKTVFWGSLTWLGNPYAPTLAGLRGGPPHAPLTWDLTEIGTGCQAPPTVARRDWDGRTEPKPDPTATPQQAAERVLGSAWLGGISSELPLSNAVTLHYGEAMDPTHPVSEYIVIVNAAQAP